MRCKRLLILLAIMASFLHTDADAQQNRARRSQVPAESGPVFVPNDQAMAAKQQLLGKIKRAGGEEKQPPNVVLILADDK